MKNALLLHGMPDREEYLDPTQPSPSNHHWFPWLQKQLQMKDIFVVALDLPEPWRPRYEAWRKEFERHDVGEQTILVGHSCGGGFLVRWLTDNPQAKVDKVVLVAPWLNPPGVEDVDGDTADFFEFEIAADLMNRANRFVMFESSNDYPSLRASAEILRNQIGNLEVRTFKDYGHFCLGDIGPEFPELLEICVS